MISALCSARLILGNAVEEANQVIIAKQVPHRVGCALCLRLLADAFWDCLENDGVSLLGVEGCRLESASALGTSEVDARTVENQVMVVTIFIVAHDILMKVAMDDVELMFCE